MKTIFISGLKILVPFLFTFLLIYWIFIGLERFFRMILLLLIDPQFYFNGLGWITALLVTTLFGLLIQIPFLLTLVNKLKKQFLKLPVIKTMYSVSSDVMTFLTKSELQQGKVVRMETPIGSIVGIMTEDRLDKLPKGVGDKNEVAVYVPMSYQIGGFTFIVPRDSVEVLDISVQKAFALTITAYISGKR